MTRSGPLLSRLLLSAAVLQGPALAAQDSFSGVGRIVAIGDVHGDYEAFVSILRQAGVVDAKGRWAGRRTHLVQTGDILDRGSDSRKVMELLMALAPQARKAGGRVHALTGNHEAMNVLGDLRYVSAGEYAAFRGRDSEALQARAWSILSDSTRRNDTTYKRQWLEEHPLGWVEHRLAFEGNGRYATWIRGNNAVVRINDFLFLHGGISPKHAHLTVEEMNAGVRSALGPAAAPQADNLADDPEGPLWYRGLASGDEAELAGHVDSVLARHGARHIVIGHTVTPGTVLPRFGGKVIMIDVGLSAAYGGPPAALIVEENQVRTLHRGQALDLPLGGDVLPYIKAAAALDPPPSRLQPLLDSLMGVVKPGR